jgi:hypothetical protein
MNIRDVNTGILSAVKDRTTNEANASNGTGASQTEGNQLRRKDRLILSPQAESRKTAMKNTISGARTNEAQTGALGGKIGIAATKSVISQSAQKNLLQGIENNGNGGLNTLLPTKAVETNKVDERIKEIAKTPNSVLQGLNDQNGQVPNPLKAKKTAGIFVKTETAGDRTAAAALKQPPTGPEKAAREVNAAKKAETAIYQTANQTNQTPVLDILG